MPTRNVACGAAEVKIAGSDPYRTLLVLQNIDAAETVDISDQNADEGIRIYPGQLVDMHQVFKDKVQHRWNAIASGAMNLRVFEGYEGKPTPEPSQRPITRGHTSIGTPRPGGPFVPGGGGGGEIHPR